jgi:8-oxo-dGTP pyrophosphatase MutT (NUDIX family)
LRVLFAARSSETEERAEEITTRVIVRERDMPARSAARSAGGAASGAEPEASAYTLTFRADDGSGVPSGLAEADVEVDFGEQHDRVPHVSDDGIEEAWRRQLLSAPRTWDAPKFRLASILVSSTAGGTTGDGRAAPAVVLRVGSTSYKEHVGTSTSSRDAASRRALREDGLATFGSESAHLSDALGVETTLETCDGGLVLLRRAAGVVGSVGKFNGPSGHPEPELCVSGRAAAAADDDDESSRASKSALVLSELFASILRECVEETGVPVASLSPPRLVGAMRDGFGKPDLLFRVETTHDSSQVVAAARRARDAWESDAVVVVSATPPADANAPVDARFHEKLTRLFWARCPETMAATTRAMAECLSPKTDESRRFREALRGSGSHVVTSEDFVW